VVLKRLDDASDDVRQASVRTLVKLFKPLPADYCMEVSFGHVDALLSSMLIHLDDPEPGFQHIMLGTQLLVTCSQGHFILLAPDFRGPLTTSHKLSQTLSEYVMNRFVNFVSFALCHEDVWKSGDVAPSFLTAELDGGEWSAACLCCFTPR
jgi:hypothetical protein